jgi:hypothetical protein
MATGTFSRRMRASVQWGLRQRGDEITRLRAVRTLRPGLKDQAGESSGAPCLSDEAIISRGVRKNANEGPGAQANRVALAIRGRPQDAFSQD